MKKTRKSLAQMKTGHAVMAVGQKLFAVGGDDRNPNNVLDTRIIMLR